MTEQEQEIIERCAVFHEQIGLPPTQGRMMAYILLTENGEATFQDFVDHLGLSKSAVSNGLTTLQAMKILEYATKPGDRKRYFRIRQHSFRTQMNERLEHMLGVRSIMSEICEIRFQKCLQNPTTDRLTLLVEYFDFLKKELPKLHDRFELGER